MTRKRWICVVAEGEASVAPDLAIVSFAVSGSGKSWRRRATTSTRGRHRCSRQLREWA